MIASATSAAFTDTAEARGNVWETGSAELSHDGSATAHFSAEGLTPGNEVTKTITVSNTGLSELEVRLYTEALVGDRELADELTVAIERDAALFNGTLQTLSNDFSAWDATGDGGTVLAAGGTQEYTVTVSVSDDAPQGSSVGIDLVWEGRTQPTG